MSDLTANNRYSFDSMNAGRVQNVILPKSQPVRLKELLHSCESDEDDSSEIEQMPCESEDELDFNELQPQDNFAENILQEHRIVHKEDVNLIESVDGPLITTGVLPKESHKIAADTSVQKRISYANDKEECKVSNVNSENYLSVGELNKLEIYNPNDPFCVFSYEEKTQKYDSNTSSSRSQTDVVHDCSTNIALPPPSLSVYKKDYNVKFDTNKNLQSMNNAQSHPEKAYMLDIINKRKEGNLYSTSMDNKMLLTKSSDYLLNLSKEDQQYKSNSFIDQASKDCEEFRKISNVESASCISTNVTHPLRYNSQYSVAKYEANEKYTPAKNACTEFSTPSLSEAGKSLTTINRLETPLKHLPVSSMHPNPCMSHKQLFRTPQNKFSDDTNKNQSSSTILSTWCHNNVRHTSVEGKNLVARDHTQTSKNTICTPIIGRSETPRYFGMDTKNVRRPLADATLARGDSLAHSFESKLPITLNSRSEAKGVVSESQREDRRTIGLSDVKLMQTETNYNNDLKSTKPMEEIQENKQSNIPDMLRSNEKTMQSKNESKQMIIGGGSGSGIKYMQDSSRNKYGKENIVSNVECKNSHEHYSIRERQHEEPQQIVEPVVQFTVSSSIPSQRQNKTLFVKDTEYLILDSLGRGMSGEVLRVQNISSGELHAIKCVDLSKMDKDSAQGCLDEISMLRKLQAPCVIRMFDYQVKESMVYVVMEMGDTDLSRLLKSMSQEKQIPLTMILYYWTEMLTAVKHIHDNGVIHSDLKPGNFLLVRGRLKLIDFGIASSINSDMTSVLKNKTIGTLNYISPEALMDIGGNSDSPTHNVKYKISFKSDVWSLGCILYSLVYGQTPFHHIRSQWAKMNAITNPTLNISFPATMNAPFVLIDVMRKCLQHDPKARPTVSQLLQVQYVPTIQNAAPISAFPDIPANVLVKIRHALNEEEWRQLLQVLDTKRHHT